MQVETFGEILKRHDIYCGSGVPCSYFKPVVNYMGTDPQLDYLPAASEGEAVSIAAGMVTAGRPAFALMQNSGLGNAVNPITSLLQIYQIPVLLLVSLRGEPGRPDEPQHLLMGQITEQLSRLCALDTFDFDPESFEQTLISIQAKGSPASWIFRKGRLQGGPTIKPAPLRLRLDPLQPQVLGAMEAQLSREQALGAMLPLLNGGPSLPAIISSTGKLSRELYELDDRDHTRHNRFYMVGSLGCAAGFGLGVARVEERRARDALTPGKNDQGRPLGDAPAATAPRPVVVLDGDGALLMKLGTLATVGMLGPSNFHHVVLDNGVHDSTGGQATASPFVDFAAIALACGYRSAETVNSESALLQCLERQLATPGPTFLRVLVRPGARPELGRPQLSPRDGWVRFCNFLRPTRG